MGLRKLILALIMGTVSCSTLDIPDASNLQIQDWQERIKAQLPTGISRQLKEHEVILPNKVMCAYAKAIDRLSMILEEELCPSGGHVSYNYFVNEEIRDNFIENMKKYGYSDTEISIYLGLLSKPGTIILNEKKIQNETKLADILKHERVHYELERLPVATYRYMMSVAKDLLARTYTTQEARESGFFEEAEIIVIEWDNRDDKRDERLPLVRFNKMYGASMKNPEEFYAYLITHDLQPGAKEVLQRDFPKAYTITRSIELRVSDVDHYAPFLSWENAQKPFVIKEDTTELPAQYCPDKPTMIGSRYCNKCKDAWINLDKAAAKQGIKVEYVDQDDPNSQMAQELGIFSDVIPATILGCKVHLGVHTMEEFNDMLQE